MEIKVGQIWKEKFGHREFTVIDHEEYQLIDNETTWLWSAPAGDFGNDLELVKDVDNHAYGFLNKAVLALEAVCEFPDSEESAWEARRNAEELAGEIANYLRDITPPIESNGE